MEIHKDNEATPLLRQNRLEKVDRSSKISRIYAAVGLGALMALIFISGSFSNSSLFFENATEDDITTISVNYNHISDYFEVTRGYLKSDVSAKGKFNRNIDGAGWNFLEVEALPADSSVSEYLHSMRAMGFTEGFLTWKEISEFYPNYYQSMFDTTSIDPQDPDNRVTKFLRENFEWMDRKSKEKCGESDHWLTVRGVIVQMEGMLQGFLRGRKEGMARGELPQEAYPVESPSNQQLTSLYAPSLLHFILLNGNGDLYEVMEKFAAEDAASAAAANTTTFPTATTDDAKGKIKGKQRRLSGEKVIGRGEDEGVEGEDALRLYLMTSPNRGDHCSSMVKVLPDKSDIVFGHNTWDDFRNAGPRIFKHYIFPQWPEEFRSTLSSPEQPSSSASAASSASAESSSSLSCDCDSKSDDGTGADHKPHMYFSSSPGVLTSVDDFYTAYTSPLATTTDESAQREDTQDNCACESHPASMGRLGVMETSLDIHNPSLYDLIVPESLFSWVRVRSANLIAHDGKQWAKRFSFDHSGTYANQWMVLDFDKFQPANTREGGADERVVMKEGLFTVVEEMPGMVKTSDQTQHLKDIGYWASYNQVFDEELSAYSGNTQLCEATREEFRQRVERGEVSKADLLKYGDRPGELNCYHTSSRAMLFKRLEKDIESVFDLRNVLDHNRFQTDVESVGDSSEALSCRQDLERAKLRRRAFGAIDGKVTSLLRADLYRDGKNGETAPEIFVRQGPTTESQEPFCWSHFEERQNDFYESLKHRISGDVGAYINALENGHAVVDWDDDDDFADSVDDDRSSSYIDDVGNDEEDAFLRKEGSDTHEKDRRSLSEMHSRNGRRRPRKPSVKYSHLGHPDCFEFDWAVVPPPSDTQ